VQQTHAYYACFEVAHLTACTTDMKLILIAVFMHSVTLNVKVQLCLLVSGDNNRKLYIKTIILSKFPSINCPHAYMHQCPERTIQTWIYIGCMLTAVYETVLDVSSSITCKAKWQ